MTRTATTVGSDVDSGFDKDPPFSKSKALAIIWLTTCVLMIGVASHGYQQLITINEEQRARFENTITNLARVNQEHALRMLQAADQVLLFVMSKYHDQANLLDLMALVSSGVTDTSLFPVAGIVDEKGIYQLSSLPFTKGLDLSDREYFKVHQAADSKAVHVSKVVLGRVSGKMSMQLSRRINKPNGSFGGVAVVAVDITYFSRFYQALVVPPDSSSLLIGLDGYVRARELNDTITFGQNLFQSEAIQRANSGQITGVFTGASMIDGKERLMAWNKVPMYPLVVAVGFSTAVLRDQQRRSRNVLLLPAAGLCALLLMLGALASVYFVRMQKQFLRREMIAAQLLASETRLKLALLGGELGAWDWNIKAASFTTNSQFPNLLGHPAGRAAYSNELFFATICPEDRDKFTDALRLHMQGKTKRFKDESRYLHKDGHWVWISITSLVINRDRAGHATRLSGTAQDVTVRVQGALALAKSEERWNLAVSGSDEGVWDWDVLAQSIFLSGRLCFLLGYVDVPQGVTLDNWKGEVHPDDLAKLNHRLLSHFRGETEFFRIELRVPCADGSYKWVLIRGRGVRGANGRVVRMTGSLSDFSRERAQRIQVEDQNERLSTIFALSPDALVSFDMAYRVNYTNPAFEQLTSLNAAGVVGLTEVELTEKINSLCAPTRLFGGLEALRLSSTVPSKDYLLIELVVPTRRVLKATLRRSDSISSAQILYLRDVTHETIVEEMKSEFLSTAAHELRTPMASILGFSEVLLTHQNNAALSQEFLTIIHTQSQHMSTILDELLDLARIEARQDKDFVFETLSLPLVVSEVVKSFNLPFGRLAPVIVIPDASIKADDGKCRQVILNVLSNAYKYSAPESAVTIKFVELQHRTKGRLCGVMIQDQGCGMTSEQLDRVFERFYRADASGKTPGTGLGMSIVKEIMELHGGYILVESDFGVGTEVTLLFPSADPQDLQGTDDGPDRLGLSQTGTPAGVPPA